VVFPEFTVDSSLAGATLEMVRASSSAEYELFGPDGSTDVARVLDLTKGQRAGCDAWPQAAVVAKSGPRSWTIGLSAGLARGIPYTSLDRLPARDSSNLVVLLSRLASQAPGDTSGTLRGLPYVVRSAFTAALADSFTFVFGELVRRVNVEANPHEERTTIIAERPVSQPPVPFTLAYSVRHVGDEESVPTTELIGLVVLENGTYAAFATRDFSDGGSFLLFARSGPAIWRLRWQSAYAGC
jgi:hypothetical protein